MGFQIQVHLVGVWVAATPAGSTFHRHQLTLLLRDMLDEILLTALAATWLFGALIFWPVARAIDPRATLSLRLLKLAFLLQFTLQLLWGIWLITLWLRDVSQIQHGLIPLYIIGTTGWIAASLAFLYWLFEHKVQG
jgi:hypothetical protein